MLPLIVGPAIGEMVGAKPGTPEYANWVSRLFFVPAVFGGIFGLLGGYFTDRLGRRRVLTWSILCYAFSAFGAGYATNIYWLLALRCTTFIGVCVEFVAATAWLAELFSDPKQRERVLGYTQAFGSVGGLMVTGAYASARPLRGQPAGDSRRARGLALHAHVGDHPGDPADPHSARSCLSPRSGRQRRLPAR